MGDPTGRGRDSLRSKRRLLTEGVKLRAVWPEKDHTDDRQASDETQSCEQRHVNSAPDRKNVLR